MDGQPHWSVEKREAVRLLRKLRCRCLLLRDLLHLRAGRHCHVRWAFAQELRLTIMSPMTLPSWKRGCLCGCMSSVHGRPLRGRTGLRQEDSLGGWP